MVTASGPISEAPTLLAARSIAARPPSEECVVADIVGANAVAVRDVLVCTWPLMMSSVLMVSAPPGWSATAFPPRATNSATNPTAHPMAFDRK